MAATNLIPTGPNSKGMVGRVFTRLTVISAAGTKYKGTRNEQPAWLCRCKCGKEKVIAENSLRAGLTTSCGCRQKEIAVECQTTHGETGTPTYITWRAMLTRCTCKSSRDFKQYGAKGITVCERWLKFENFLADMGPRPTGTTIDRYPNQDGNYEPGNCRWATNKEQGLNRQRTRMIAVGGGEMCLSDLAAACKAGHGTISKLLAHGLSGDQILSRFTS